ncbi:MAG: Mur ligase domain-containing protein, partial [Ginsengibacter sp.]
MKLQDLLYKVNIRSVVGSRDVVVNDVQIDSRKIKNGSLFIAVKGVAADGHQFIDKAIDSGAAVVVCEIIPLSVKDGITYV